MSIRRLLFGLTATITFAACSSDNRPGGTTNPGVKDTGVHEDAMAGTTDTGTPGPMDGSAPIDTGMIGIDATTPMDATAPMDAMSPPDTGSPFDGGTLQGDMFDPATIAPLYAQALCGYRTRCEPAFYDYLGSSEGECITETTQAFLNFWPAFAEAIDAGRAAFSRTAFDRCTAAYGSADCITGVSRMDCEGIFIGNRPAGAPCGSGIECTPDTWCALQQLGGCGTCTARAAPGTSCATTLCALGSDCFNVQNMPVCVSLEAAENASCGTVASGLCGGRLQCVGAPGMGTCRRPAGPMMACDPTAMTQPACNIFQNQVCNPMGNTCTMATFNGVGTMCNDVAQCDYTGECSMAGMCVALPAAGQACSEGICARGNFCNASNMCQAEVMMGGTCMDSVECGSYYCVNGTCGVLDWMQCN